MTIYIKPLMLMKVIKLYLFILLILFLNSCGRYNNDKIIKTLVEEMTENKENYIEIFSQIDSLKVNKNAYKIKYWPNLIPHIGVAINGSTEFRTDKVNYLFFLEHDIYSISVVNNEKYRIVYRRFSNKDHGDAMLVYLKDRPYLYTVEYQDLGYELLAENQRPTRNSKWVYIIDYNWIIVSCPYKVWE